MSEPLRFKLERVLVVVDGTTTSEVLSIFDTVSAALAESQREVERLRVYEEGARITVNALNDTVEFEQRRVEKLREALKDAMRSWPIGMPNDVAARIESALADDGKGKP
jgi:hypothetical protein